MLGLDTMGATAGMDTAMHACMHACCRSFCVHHMLPVKKYLRGPQDCLLLHSAYHSRSLSSHACRAYGSTGH